MRHWSSAYLGREPVEPAPCLELARMVQEREAGWTLPDLAQERGPTPVGFLVARNGTRLRYSKFWVEVPIDEAQELDIIVFKHCGMETHCGVVVEPGLMLHVGPKITARVEQYDHEVWAPQISRVLRWHPCDEEATSEGGFVGMPRFGDAGNLLAVDPPYRATILEAVRLMFPKAKAEHLRHMRVVWNGEFVPLERWHSIRPKVWDELLLYTVPGASFNLRSILLLVVAVAAIAISGGVLGPAGLFGGTFGGFFAAGSTSAALLSAAVAIGGALLVNALFPIPKPDTGGQKNVYSINGFQNQANPDQPFPMVLGFIRFDPQLAVMPYTEGVGEDRYITALLLCGQAPVNISDPLIGETPLNDTNFQDFKMEFVEDDEPRTIYLKQVAEEGLSVALDKQDLPHIRRTARDITHWNVELFFPRGLFGVTNKGDRELGSIQLRLRYRRVEEASWTEETLTIDGSFSPFWRTKTVEPGGDRGQWEIELTRLSAFTDETANTSTSCVWSAIRGFRPEPPINYSRRQQLLALRMKANGELNGTIDNLSLMGRLVAMDYEYTTETWVLRETNNPASIARWLRQGPMNEFPDPDENIDLDDLAEWHDYNRINGLQYNKWVTGGPTRDDLLEEVCIAGNAQPFYRGDKWTVIIDRTQTLFRDHINATNCLDVQEIVEPRKFPDGFRTTFRDETFGYKEVSRVVPFPGFSGVPEITEFIPTPGKTDPDDIWMTLRRRQYEAIYRDRTYVVHRDVQHFGLQRGQATLLSHYILQDQSVSSRVKEVRDDGVLLFDPVNFVEGTTYRGYFSRSDGTVFSRGLEGIGETAWMTYTEGSTDEVPEEGYVVTVAPDDQPPREVIVRDIQMERNGRSTLTLVPHAPEIETFMATEVPEPWDGRFGTPADADSTAPTTPRIIAVRSSQESAGGTSLEIAVAPGLASVPVKRYEIEHKLVAESAYSIVDVDETSPIAVVTGEYVEGDEIDIQVRAFSFEDVPSDYAVYDGPYVYGVNDTRALDVVGADIAEIQSGLWELSWTLETAESGVTYDPLYGVLVRGREGIWDDWYDLNELHEQPLTSTPWALPVDLTGESFYTIAVRSVSIFEEEGAPYFLYYAQTEEGFAAFVDDDDDFFADDEDDILVEEAD